MWVNHEFIGVLLFYFKSTMKLNEREIEIQSCINLVFESVCNLRQIIFNALMILKIMSLLRFYRISCCFNAGTLNLQSMIYNFQTTINHKFTKRTLSLLQFLYPFFVVEERFSFWFWINSTINWFKFDLILRAIYFLLD